MSDKLRISQVLGGAAKVGDTITVQGWVRTRRDSKAGLSFVQIHDGSCFDTFQLVCQQTLENY
jgi:asparaginyl-tRNA synthetase